MRTPLLLLCVLALLTACDDQQPNTHHRSPRNPPADTSGLQFTDYVRWSSRPYSVDAYLEPNIVFGNWTDYTRGEADLFFFTALPPTTASAAAAADRLNPPRQLFAPQRDTSPADSLRAELLEADGTPTDISHRCTLTYTDFEPYLRSGYRKYYRQTTRRFDEMTTEQLMWVEPELKIHCQFPALAPQQSLRIVATLADGRTLRGTLEHTHFFYRY